jgi:hypothetical protein
MTVPQATSQQYVAAALVVARQAQALWWGLYLGHGASQFHECATGGVECCSAQAMRR